VGLKPNGTHLAYANGVNLLGNNIDTVKKNTLNEASREAGLEVNIDKIKYMLLAHHQNAGQDHGIKIARR
jgi:hypothetical protein